MCSDILPWSQRQRYGGQAAGQGRVGWCGVQGRANHPLMGNTLFSMVWIAPSTTVGGEVAGVQQGTGIQKQSMVWLSHAIIPGYCEGAIKKHIIQIHETQGQRDQALSHNVLFPPLSAGFFIRRWATGHKTHNRGEKQVWWLSVGVRSQCYCQYIFNKKEGRNHFFQMLGKIQTCSCKCNSTAVFVEDGNQSLTLSQDPNTRESEIPEKKSSCFESSWQLP